MIKPTRVGRINQEHGVEIERGMKKVFVRVWFEEEIEREFVGGPKRD